VTFTSEIINLRYIGQEFEYYVWQRSDNAYRYIGNFIVKDVTKSKNRYTVVAYDYVCLFDEYCADCVQHLVYPITLGNMFVSICNWFGTLAYSPVFTNSTFSIEQDWTDSSITGR